MPDPTNPIEEPSGRRPDPHEQAVEAMALARCPGRDHSPLLCPALDVYRRQAREQLEAALPHLQQERPDPEDWINDWLSSVGESLLAPSQVRSLADHLTAKQGQEIATCPECGETSLGGIDPHCAGTLANAHPRTRMLAPQPNPPSRAGEVAEEIDRIAMWIKRDRKESDKVLGYAQNLRRLASDLRADKLTEQEPSREERINTVLGILDPTPQPRPKGMAQNLERQAEAIVDAISEKGRDG